MKEREWTIEVYHSNEWRFAHRSVMTKGCAEGLLNQFGQDYRARLVNDCGKVVLHRGSNADTHSCNKKGRGR